MNAFLKKSPVELVNELYDAYKDKTEGSFHNCLWQVLVNECRDVLAHDSCFVLLYGRVYNVGIADRGQSGYTPTSFGLKADVPIEERNQIIADLNARIFGLSPDECHLIVAGSMKTAQP